jgi:iron(III)-salmochelin esterase
MPKLERRQVLHASCMLPFVALAHCTKRGDPPEVQRREKEGQGTLPPPATLPALFRDADVSDASADGSVDRGLDGSPSPGRSMFVGTSELLELTIPMRVEHVLDEKETRTFVIAPRDRLPTRKLALLVALHGRGEARKGPRRGGLGWPEDYALLRALDRARRLPIQAEDYEGHAEPKRLGEINQSLANANPQDFVIACPYVPDLDLREASQVDAYSKWLVMNLLPTLRELDFVATTVERTGIDGVSLGGAIALHAGFSYPNTFGVVGALQAAIQVSDGAAWGERAARAAKVRSSRIRLVTSSQDYFRDSVRNLSEVLRGRKVEHEFYEVKGPHDYSFNRGPGCYELLEFHRRALG